MLLERCMEPATKMNAPVEAVPKLKLAPIPLPVALKERGRPDPVSVALNWFPLYLLTHCRLAHLLRLLILSFQLNGPMITSKACLSLTGSFLQDPAAIFSGNRRVRKMVQMVPTLPCSRRTLRSPWTKPTKRFPFNTKMTLELWKVTLRSLGTV